MGRKRVEIQLWWEVPLVELPKMKVQSYSLGERGEEDDDPRAEGSVGAGMSGMLPKILMRGQVGALSVEEQAHQEEMKSGLTAFTSSQVIGPDKSKPLGMPYPICGPVLVGSPSTRDIRPLGVGKGFVPSP